MTMDPVTRTGGSGSDLTPGIPKDDPKKIQQAARDFEALLIGNLLKMAHGPDGGWLGTSGDDADASAMDYAQESLAQALSANGGLGLSRSIADGLGARSGS